MKRVLIDVESYTGTPTLRYCIICIKSAIYNEMCRDAQGYTGKGTMSLYFRPLRNPLIHSRLRKQLAVFVCDGRGARSPDGVHGNSHEGRQARRL